MGSFILFIVFIHIKYEQDSVVMYFSEKKTVFRTNVVLRDGFYYQYSARAFLNIFFRQLKETKCFLVGAEMKTNPIPNTAQQLTDNKQIIKK